jgi:hypothetical protein
MGDGVAVLTSVVSMLEDVAAAPACRGLGSQVPEEVLLLLEAQAVLDVALLARLHAFDSDDMSAGTGFDSTTSWLSAHGRMDVASAGAQVRLARRLNSGELERTREAFESGHLSRAHAAVISHGVAGVAVEHREGLEATLVESSRQLRPADLRDLVAQVRVRLCSEQDSLRRWELQQASRSFNVVGLDSHDLGLPTGQLIPELTAAIRTVFDALGGRTGPDDLRSRTQRQHDALHEAIRWVLDSGRLGERGGVRPHLNITVDLDDLLARAGAGQLDRVEDRHGAHGAALAPDTVQRMTCDAEVSWTLVRGMYDVPTAEGSVVGLDPAVLRKVLASLPAALGGTPLEVLAQGRSRRTVTPAQRRALNVRDKGCVVVGCTAHWTRCEAHHLDHWSQGGGTDADVMVLLCSRHHHLGHEGRHDLVRDRRGRWRLRPPAPIHPRRAA